MAIGWKLAALALIYCSSDGRHKPITCQPGIKALE